MARFRPNAYGPLTACRPAFRNGRNAGQIGPGGQSQALIGARERPCGSARTAEIRLAGRPGTARGARRRWDRKTRRPPGRPRLASPAAPLPVRGPAPAWSFRDPPGPWLPGAAAPPLNAAGPADPPPGDPLPGDPPPGEPAWSAGPPAWIPGEPARPAYDPAWTPGDPGWAARHPSREPDEPPWPASEPPWVASPPPWRRATALPGRPALAGGRPALGSRHEPGR